MASWNPVSLSGPETVEMIFPQVSGMNDVATRAEDQQNTGVVPVLNVHPEVLKKMLNFMFGMNTRIKGLVDRSNGREAPKVLAVNAFAMACLEVAKRLPREAKKKVTEDMGLTEGFESVVTNPSELFMSTVDGVTVLEKHSSDDLEREPERLRFMAGQEGVGGGSAGGKGPNQEVGKIGDVVHHASTAQSSPHKLPPPVHGTDPQGAGPSEAHRTRSYGRVTVSMNTETQHERAEKLILGNQSTFTKSGYVTNVFTELVWDMCVRRDDGVLVALRRSMWEGKSELTTGFRTKVNQAGKTCICGFIHNLARGVRVKNVYVILGDDEKFILVQFTPRSGSKWNIGNPPSELEGDLFFSEHIELTKKNPAKPSEFEAERMLLMGGAYIVKAFLGNGLAGLDPAQMENILVDINVGNILAAIMEMKQAFDERSLWFPHGIRMKERKLEDQSNKVEVDLPRSRGARPAPRYNTTMIDVPERPLGDDPDEYEYDRILEQATRLEAVAKILRERAATMKVERKRDAEKRLAKAERKMVKYA